MHYDEGVREGNPSGDPERKPVRCIMVWEVHEGNLGDIIGWFEPKVLNVHTHHRHNKQHSPSTPLVFPRLRWVIFLLAGGCVVEAVFHQVGHVHE